MLLRRHGVAEESIGAGRLRASGAGGDDQGHDAHSIPE
jgi:hypothetical protein